MVEWKKLGEEVSYYRGVTYNKKQEVALNSGGTKILRANNIDLNTNTLLFDDVKEISSDVRIKDYQWLLPNDILICAGSGSIEHVGKVAYITEKIDFAYGGFMGKLVTSKRLKPRYLFHVITSLLFKKYLETALNSTTINNLNSEIINNFQIPIPSLSEQTRIVGILDSFTSAISNLKEQIAQRRKQYEYYRDQLLDLEGEPGVEMKTLGEIANLVRGKVISKDYIRDFEGEYPVYSSQTANNGILGKINSYMFDGDFLTWTTDGAYAGTVFRRSGRFNITNVCGLIDIKNKSVERNYLYYWLSVTAKKYVQEGMGNPKLMSNVASTIKCPIISLQEQQHIVSILDTFEASIQNLEEQLKLREKQYEYYRNKLLTFE